MSKISINYIGHSHSDWMRSLDFYKQEIGILKSRLTEIGGKNTASDVAAQLEHFENQFLLQQVNIDKLQHEINAHIHALSQQAELSAGHVDAAMRDSHNALGDQVQTEEKVVNDLRKEFNLFSVTWM